MSVQDIAAKLGGRDTARVEELRKVMSHYEAGIVRIAQYPNRSVESRKALLDQNQRITLERITGVLDEDWSPCNR